MTHNVPRFDFNKAFIGFDRLFNEVEQRCLNTNNYPPYNILQIDDDTYVIELAAAGFSRGDVSIELHQNQLRVVGKKQEKAEVSKAIYKGLATRNFEKVFTLAEHMEVESATMADGILRITAKRVVPEQLKPRQIQID